MKNNQTSNSKLVLSYISDENNYHCICDCGLKIILTKEQFESKTSCGCENRKLMWLASGKSEEECGYEMKLVQSPTAGYSEERGLNFDKKKNKWRARITFQSKEFHLGYFVEKDEALEARREAVKHLNSGFVEWYNSVYKSN